MVPNSQGGDRRLGQGRVNQAGPTEAVGDHLFKNLSLNPTILNNYDPVFNFPSGENFVKKMMRLLLLKT